MALIGNNNPEKMFNFLRQQGFTEAGSAAVVGNGYAESGCSPINLQNNGNSCLLYTSILAITIQRKMFCFFTTI